MGSEDPPQSQNESSFAEWWRKSFGKSKRRHEESHGYSAKRRQKHEKMEENEKMEESPNVESVVKDKKIAALENEAKKWSADAEQMKIAMKAMDEKIDSLTETNASLLKKIEALAIRVDSQDTRNETQDTTNDLQAAKTDAKIDRMKLKMVTGEAKVETKVRQLEAATDTVASECHVLQQANQEQQTAIEVISKRVKGLEKREETSASTNDAIMFAKEQDSLFLKDQTKKLNNRIDEVVERAFPYANTSMVTDDEQL